MGLSHDIKSHSEAATSTIVAVGSGGTPTPDTKTHSLTPTSSTAEVGSGGISRHLDSKQPPSLFHNWKWALSVGDHNEALHGAPFKVEFKNENEALRNLIDVMMLFKLYKVWLTINPFEDGIDLIERILSSEHTVFFFQKNLAVGLQLSRYASLVWMYQSLCSMISPQQTPVYKLNKLNVMLMFADPESGEKAVFHLLRVWIIKKYLFRELKPDEEQLLNKIKQICALNEEQGFPEFQKLLWTRAKAINGISLFRAKEILAKQQLQTPVLQLDDLKPVKKPDTKTVAKTPIKIILDCSLSNVENATINYLTVGEVILFSRASKQIKIKVDASKVFLVYRKALGNEGLIKKFYEQMLEKAKSKQFIMCYYDKKLFSSAYCFSSHEKDFSDIVKVLVETDQIEAFVYFLRALASFSLDKNYLSDSFLKMIGSIFNDGIRAKNPLMRMHFLLSLIENHRFLFYYNNEHASRKRWQVLPCFVEIKNDLLRQIPLVSVRFPEKKFKILQFVREVVFTDIHLYFHLFETRAINFDEDQARSSGQLPKDYEELVTKYLNSNEVLYRRIALIDQQPNPIKLFDSLNDAIVTELLSMFSEFIWCLSDAFGLKHVSSNKLEAGLGLIYRPGCLRYYVLEPEMLKSYLNLPPFEFDASPLAAKPSSSGAGTPTADEKLALEDITHAFLKWNQPSPPRVSQLGMYAADNETVMVPDENGYVVPVKLAGNR